MRNRSLPGDRNREIVSLRTRLVVSGRAYGVDQSPGPPLLDDPPPFSEPSQGWHAFHKVSFDRSNGLAL
jgi:hypothetical protein